MHGRYIPVLYCDFQKLAITRSAVINKYAISQLKGIVMQIKNIVELTLAAALKKFLATQI